MNEHLLKRVEELVNIYGLDTTSGYRNQLKALKEEIDELISALDEKNLIETLDAIGDTLFVALTLEIIEKKHGIYESEMTVEQLSQSFDKALQNAGLDISVEDIVEEVVSSNESKLDKTPEEASKTVEYYWGMGVPTFIRAHKNEQGKHVFCVIVEEDTVVDGKMFFKGKFLKSVTHYREPDFYKLLA